MSKSTLEVGHRVVVGAAGSSKKGAVAFIGETQFAAGEWVGVVLDAAEGKNDGTVAGVRYFDCEPNFGLFVKRAQVKMDRSEGARDPPAEASPAPASEAAQQHGERLAALRRRRESALPGRAPTPVDSGEPSVTACAPAPTAVEQPAVTTPSGRTTAPPSSSSNAIALEAELIEQTAAVERLRAGAAVHEALLSSLQSEHRLREEEHSRETASLRDRLRELETSASANDAAVVAARRESAAALAESETRVEALTTEIATMRGQIEHISSTRGAAESARVLQLEKALADMRDRVSSLEEQLTDTLDTMEAVTLDKEQLALEMEELEERHGALQREFQTAKGNVAPEISANPGDPADLEAQNARLKEALRRLQAVSAAAAAQHELSLREALAAAARDALSAQSTLEERSAAEIMILNGALEKASRQIDELSQMVDAAAESETMVEKLTEENLMLSQANQDMATVVRDLEEAAEIMEELDASQRSDITSLRREAEDREAELSNARVEISKLCTKLEEVGRGAGRALKQYEESKENCDRLQVEIDTQLEKSLGAAERRREIMYTLAKRSFFASSERCKELSLSVVRLEIDLRAAEAKKARALAMLPVGGEGCESGAVTEMVGAELQRADTEIAVARALSALLYAHDYCRKCHVDESNVLSTAIPAQRESLNHSERTVSDELLRVRECASKLLLASVGDAVLSGAGVCWWGEVLLSESARMLAEEVGSPRALQWEDNVLALQAAMYALEQVVVGRLLPCLDDTGIVGMGIDSCGEVIYSRLSKLLSARDDVIIAINRLDLSLSFDRLVQLSAGMCSVPRAPESAHDDRTATPMSAEWFASALHNIINRLRKHAMSSPPDEDGRAAMSLLQTQVDYVLEVATTAVKKAAAEAVQCTSTSLHSSDDEDTNPTNDSPELTAVRDALCGALGQIYETLQDSSNVFFSSFDDEVLVADAALQSDYLLDSKAMWNKLVTWDSIPTDRLESPSWIRRVADIRSQFRSLVEAQTQLSSAVASADDLQRENVTLVVELRAAKCKVADLLLICESTSKNSSSGPLTESLKKENEILTEALAVLEQQLDEQHELYKSKTPVGAESTPGGNVTEAVPVSGHATPGTVGLLWNQLSTWRGVACRRLLSESLGGMTPLPVIDTAPPGCGVTHSAMRPKLSRIGDVGPKLGATSIYREVRRTRARVKVVSVSPRGSSGAIACGDRTSAAVALRWVRDRHSAQCSVVTLRDTLGRMLDESPAFKARRSQQ